MQGYGTKLLWVVTFLCKIRGLPITLRYVRRLVYCLYKPILTMLVGFYYLIV